MSNNWKNREYAKRIHDLEDELENDLAQARQKAWHLEPKPISEVVDAKGLPLGHIAFQGDFDTPNVDE